MSDVHRCHDVRRRNIAVIGVASGMGATDPGCGGGPGVHEAPAVSTPARLHASELISALAVLGNHP